MILTQAIDKDTINQLVFDRDKPSRYVGGEYNQIVKKNATFRMAISYPDLYEIGMTNQGLQILYSLVNNMEDLACERVFAVAPDFEEKVRKMDIPLYSLETFTPLNLLDAVGFNLAHELLYTNVLQVLDLGSIPLLRTEREENDPVIIAGGAAASNPAPMCDFIDAFYIGDGEEGIVEIAESLKKSKDNNDTRKKAIEMLENIDGVFVSSLHGFEYIGTKLIAIKGREILKRTSKTKYPDIPEKPLVPNIRITQDKAVVEVMRGCSNLCKFCQAGYLELPCRHFTIDDIKQRVFSIITNTGYSELTLSSLSISDYRDLHELLNTIMPVLTEKGISISLPSLRVNLDSLPLIKHVSGLRKTSLTFAVESASEEMRMLAHKKLCNHELLQIMEQVFSQGWRTVKLYFMIGLPGFDEINEAEITSQLLWEIHKLKKGKKDINVTVSPFVPKPHTPFQRERQMEREYFKETVRQLKSNAPRSVKIKNHDIQTSIIEGVLSRGDIRLGPVILQSFKDGCRHDSWSEYFKYDLWEKNLNNLIPAWHEYLSERSVDETLPWGNIYTGFERLTERMRTKQTADETIKHRKHNKTEFIDLSAAMKKFEERYGFHKRARMRLSKRGFAKYIPHIDLIEIVKRSLRMAEAPVSYSRGFNKREKISAGHPLPVGIASECELVDVDLYMETDLDALMPKINERLPMDIHLIDMHYPDNNSPLMKIVNAVEYRVSTLDGAILDTIKKNLENRISFEKKTKSGTKSLSFDEVIVRHEQNISGFNITVMTGNENSIRIDSLLCTLAEIDYEDFYKLEATRTMQFEIQQSHMKEIV